MIIFRVPFVFPGTFRSFCYLIGSGLLGFLGQTLLSVGLQGEKAGRGSLVMYLQVSSCARPRSRRRTSLANISFRSSNGSILDRSSSLASSTV